MKNLVCLFLLGLSLCNLEGVYPQISHGFNGATTNLYEYGAPIIKSEDNIINLFKNFPLYVENGEDIDFLSYEFVGTIKHKRDAKKFVKKNYDENFWFSWTTVFYRNNADISENIPSSAEFFTENPLPILGKKTIRNMINTISEEYVHIGDEVYAIDYVVELQKHRHYIFVNPTTKKVLLKGNIFGIEIPITHIEYINEAKKITLSKK
jgi:hypothetical protein